MRLSGFLAALLTAASLHANDWAAWRGPEMNGVSRETNLVGDWSLDPAKNVLWTSEVGGRATPIVSGGRVYLNCRTPDDVSVGSKELVDAAEQVVCWDAKTGEILWRDRFNVFGTDIPAPRVGWASMVADTEEGLVYVHTVSGLLRCYTPDGKVLWTRSLSEEFGEITGYGGRLTTPLIDEDRLIVAIPCLNWGDTGYPPPKHTFYAFDKRTGKLLWTAAPGGAIADTFYSNPVVAVIGGVRQIVSGNGDGGVYGIEARTGETLWGMKMSKRGLNASVVVEGNYVYASHGEDDVKSSEFGRVQCIDATQRGDLTDTDGVWAAYGVKAGYASPCIHDGILYVVSDLGGLIAFDAKDGKVLWEYKIGTVGKGSPVWADGKIYVMEVNGRIHVLKVSREKCEKVSENALLARVDKGTDEIYGSPAISDGRVFFCTRDRLICVGEPDKAEDGEIPPMPQEADPQDEIATIQLVPYETTAKAGDRIEYQVRAFDANGVFLKTIDDYKLTAGKGLEGSKVVETQDAKPLGTLVAGKYGLKMAADAKLPQAGIVTVEAAGKTATARVLSYPPLPWSWDMEELPVPAADAKPPEPGAKPARPPAMPGGWINGNVKLRPVKLDGSTILKSNPSQSKGKPSFAVTLGPPEMKGYVVAADVRVDGKRSLSSVGLTNQRYDFILKANSNQLAIQTWAAHLRINETQKLKKDPAGKWYRLKFAVEVKEGVGHLRGKMWPRDEAEPDAWTIEATDPNPNLQGSPGLYVYQLDDAYFDNVSVTAAGADSSDAAKPDAEKPAAEKSVGKGDGGK